jgi:hypothetical protein
MAVGIVESINEKSEGLDDLEFESLMDFLSESESEAAIEKTEALEVAPIEDIVAAVELDSELVAAVELATEVVPSVKKERKAKVAKEKVVKEKVVAEEKVIPRDFYALLKSDVEPGVDIKVIEAGTHELIEQMNNKVGAKCANLFTAANGLGGFSVFVRIGLEYVLTAKQIEKDDFVAYFMDEARNSVSSYAKSTAQPQATNLLSLFVAVKILNKTDKEYAVNPESLLLEKVRKLLP